MSESRNGGVDAAGLLGVLFVGLKLGGVIDWSWWWVTLPFWGGLAFMIGFLLIAGVVAGAAKLGKKAGDRSVGR